MTNSRGQRPRTGRPGQALAWYAVNHKWLATVVTGFALWGLGGCDKGGSGGGEAPPGSVSTVAPAATSAPTPSAAAPSAVAEKPKGPERGPGHGGVDGVLFRAVRDLPLREDQKTKVATLEEQLRDRDTGPRDAMKTLYDDLAAQVRTGRVDAAKLQPDESAVDAAMKVMLGKQATALAGLHDTLDADQRKALADAVHARTASKDAGASDWVARRTGRMTQELGLDAGQQKQIGALVAKQPSPSAMHDETSKQVDAIMSAFQGETFDAAKALQPTMKTAHDALDRQITFSGQVLAVLHPDQREKLASTLSRAGAHAGGSGADEEEGRGGGGGGGGGGEH